MVQRRKMRRREFNLSHRRMLEWGYDHLNLSGWGDYRSSELPVFTAPPPNVFAEMRKAWAEFREIIFAEWDFLSPQRAGTQPWFWWFVESPQPRDESIDETRQLHLMGLLTGDELEAVKSRVRTKDARMHYNSWNSGLLPFRRDWDWWEWMSPEPRDPARFESSQLVAMGVLTRLEQAILDDPGRAVREWGYVHRTRYFYMSEDERKLLALNEFHDETGMDDFVRESTFINNTYLDDQAPAGSEPTHHLENRND